MKNKFTTTIILLIVVLVMFPGGANCGIVAVHSEVGPMMDPGMNSSYADCPEDSSCGQAMEALSYIGSGAVLGLGISNAKPSVSNTENLNHNHIVPTAASTPAGGS